MTSPLHSDSAALCRQTLKSSDLCRGLDERAVDQLLSIGRLRDYRAGAQILCQGSPVDSLFLPVTGSQRVERSGAAGQRQVLAFLQRGDYLGFSTGDHYLYSAYAIEDSQLLNFPVGRFQPLAEQLPPLRDNLGRIANQVLARLIDHLFAIGQKRAHARLAFLLWQLAERNGSADRLLRLPMRRIDIADYLGLTLETTSRAFSRLRDDGVIATPDAQQVHILDHRALIALAEVQ